MLIRFIMIMKSYRTVIVAYYLFFFFTKDSYIRVIRSKQFKVLLI